MVLLIRPCSFQVYTAPFTIKNDTYGLPTYAATVATPYFDIAPTPASPLYATVVPFEEASAA